MEWMMGEDRTETFADVLSTIAERPSNAWIYLPNSMDWSLESESLTLVSEKVPLEDEDLPDAGVPESAKQKGLSQVIDVPTLQDIESNLLAQNPTASIEELFSAFIFYHRHDSFVQM